MFEAEEEDVQICRRSVNYGWGGAPKLFRSAAAHGDGPRVRFDKPRELTASL